MTFSHLLRDKIDVLYCSAQTTSIINIGCLSLIFFKLYTWYRLLKTKCAASRIEKKIMTVTKQVFSSTPPNYHRLNKVVERNNLFLRTDRVRQHVNELPNMQDKKKKTWEDREVKPKHLHRKQRHLFTGIAASQLECCNPLCCFNVNRFLSFPHCISNYKEIFTITYFFHTVLYFSVAKFIFIVQMNLYMIRKLLSHFIGFYKYIQVRL